jgi:hypothetical protein
MREWAKDQDAYTELEHQLVEKAREENGRKPKEEIRRPSIREIDEESKEERRLSPPEEEPNEVVGAQWEIERQRLEQEEGQVLRFPLSETEEELREQRQWEEERKREKEAEKRCLQIFWEEQQAEPRESGKKEMRRTGSAAREGGGRDESQSAGTQA